MESSRKDIYHKDIMVPPLSHFGQDGFDTFQSHIGEPLALTTKPRPSNQSQSVQYAPSPFLNPPPHQLYF